MRPYFKTNQPMENKLITTATITTNVGWGSSSEVGGLPRMDEDQVQTLVTLPFKV